MKPAADPFAASAETFAAIDARYGQFRRPPCRACSQVRQVLAAAFDTMPTAELVLDRESTLVLATTQARTMFGLVDGDFGRPVRDLALFRHLVKLAPYVDLNPEERKLVEINAMPWSRDGEQRTLDVHITALTSGPDRLGTSISYTDVTRRHRLKEQAADAHRELDQVHEELRAVVEQFDVNLEELRTTGEQLDAAHEDLLLANAGLEQINRQLASAHAERRRVNDELHARIDALEWRNALLATILTTVNAPVNAARQ